MHGGELMAGSHALIAPPHAAGGLPGATPLWSTSAPGGNMQHQVSSHPLRNLKGAAIMLSDIERHVSEPS